MDKIRIGIFGAWRGGSFIPIVSALDDYELTALCDKNPDTLKSALSSCGEGVKAFSDFDEFIECGLDAVILANYFNEHTPYAIKAMERGIHVFSECTSASTLAECVALCEAVERTGAKYMIAENYPFTAGNLELRRLYQAGLLGSALYGEGEYNHGASEADLRYLTPGKYHWRAWMPRSYYVTHALGPLMHITESMPVKVNALAVHSDELAKYDFRLNCDAYAMMSVRMDDGSMFRVTGCAAIPSPSRYRIVGERGSAECGGIAGGNVNVSYFPWMKPESEAQSSSYAPQWPDNADIAAQSGHGGGDFWTIWNFARYIKDGVEPYFNVYRGVAMSAVGILGWRSCLNDGAAYKIPDFRDIAERRLVESDNLTPFPDGDGNGATLPPALPY